MHDLIYKIVTYRTWSKWNKCKRQNLNWKTETKQR